ncbi:MAG: type II secretion system GspH family protein [Phycisphaerae bacterium]|nr:hypothetical protein [Phycisphaerae bacterium]MCZ2399743.1 type II secretion system GspH family protein [Phycisphaerae bacterium]
MKRRAALLLEVVVALTIMVMALGLLAGQLINSIRATSEAEVETRAAQLTDRMLSLLELDPNVAGSLLDTLEADGDFGEENPGWFWRVAVLPLEDVPGLGQVRLDVLLQRNPDKLDDVETADVVRTVVMLKAAPGRIDLASDFGVDPNRLEELSGQIPIPGIDLKNLDPQALVSMTPEQLMELLPMLLAILQQVAPGMAGQLGGLGGGQIPSPEDVGGLIGGGGLPGMPGLPGGVGPPGGMPPGAFPPGMGQRPGGGPGQGGGAGAGAGARRGGAGRDGAGADLGGFGGGGGRQRIGDLDRNRGPRRGGGGGGGGGAPRGGGGGGS